jgi:hypothetical protein
MKINKTISEKVIAANRANARNSTGPKTLSGKRHSKLNAKSHGLFAQELHFGKGEELEFETLKRDLLSQLLPETALQRLAVDEILSCAWRTKLAARLETDQLRAALDERASLHKGTEVPRDDAVAGWYAANRGNLQSGIRFLGRLRDDVKTHGRVREFFKDDLVLGFGTDFYDLLYRWLPVNVDTIAFTDQMLHHEETYKLPLPDKIPRVVVDVRAHLEMVVKLIEQQAHHLEDLAQSFEQRANPAGERSTDFAPRFFTSAARDLHRAIDWFAHLKVLRM